jgi:hypothetical protein
LDTVDGPYNKTGYQLEHRDDGFAITVGLQEHISGGGRIKKAQLTHHTDALGYKIFRTWPVRGPSVMQQR